MFGINAQSMFVHGMVLQATFGHDQTMTVQIDFESAVNLLSQVT
jgi:hypothetical protein